MFGKMDCFASPAMTNVPIHGSKPISLNTGTQKIRLYRTIGAALAWFALLAQYPLTIAQSGLLAGTIIYFSFFTILSNLLVALAFTAPLLPGNRLAFFRRPAVRTAIAVYILVVSAIFILLLRKLYHPAGLGYYINILLDYANPPLYLADWLIFVPKRQLRFTDIPAMLVFPLLFAAWTLAHGAFSGWYPYPFLDVETFGYQRVFINIGFLAALFAGLAAIFTAAGRKLPPR
jgi:hypothetical protein